MIYSLGFNVILHKEALLLDVTLKMSFPLSYRPFTGENIPFPHGQGVRLY